MFKDQVIRLWVVTYDNDPELAYTFTAWNKVLSGIAGSIVSYIDDHAQSELAVDGIIGVIAKFSSTPYIPLNINNLFIVIQGFDIDHTNPIHKIISKCYSHVDDDIKLEILSFFGNSV